MSKVPTLNKLTFTYVSIIVVLYATLNIILSTYCYISFKKIRSGFFTFWNYFPISFEEDASHEHDRDFMKITMVNDAHSDHNRTTQVQQDYEDKLQFDRVCV
jgi:hypothetical protein